MMQQYLQIKERYRDAILFFRLGDFYAAAYKTAERAGHFCFLSQDRRSFGGDVGCCVRFLSVFDELFW